MAYRVKGFLSLKDKNTLESYMHNYEAALKSVETDTQRILLEGFFKFFYNMCIYMLWVDNAKIIQKLITKEAKHGSH